MKTKLLSVRPGNSQHQGFTLLELMIVLAVLAVLLGWGMPSLTQSIRNNQVLAQTNELIAMLHFAKSEALRRNVPDDERVEVSLNPEDGGWSAFVLVEDAGDPPEGCEVGQLRCSSNTDVLLSGSTEQILFNNRGYIRSEDEDWNPETLFVQHTQCEGNSQRRRIDITATGQVSSCSLPCDVEDACQ
ncbi:MAG TPA: GspH/FimT family pseudopilin [Xanthomonadales bacterium]|nr:GspH/FimT family pseudopilin [Xanthomonadales bacterium]